LTKQIDKDKTYNPELLSAENIIRIVKAAKEWIEDRQNIGLARWTVVELYRALLVSKTNWLTIKLAAA
jgi:hypothetical protein